MDFRILGPLEIATDDGLVEVRGIKPRALLALLLIHANEVVSAERLIEDLWEGNPPRSAMTTLQTYVSQLRKQLGLATLQTRPTGYRLTVAPDAFDAFQFERRVGAVVAAVSARPSWVVEQLQEALALWRGHALADFAGAHWAEPEAGRLDELRLGAREDCFEARLALGEHARLVPELEALVVEQPMRERLWGQLMVALYRAGRQADALRAYARVREVLIEELGVDPGPELRALERAVLAQDPALAAPVGRTAVAGAPGLPTGLTVPIPPAIDWAATTTFVGRRPELARLADFTHTAHNEFPQLVVIAGEPGIGKTSLAVRAALAARDEGATVLVGRCDEQSLRPYQPFAEAFEHYVRSCMLDSGAPQLERMASEFAPLLPDLADELPDEPATTPGESARLRLFENVASFLARLSADAPVMVVLDDLHWADASTLLLLHHLLGSSQSAAVLFVATLRHTEPSGRAVLNQLLDVRRGRIHRLHLAGLADDQVMIMVAPLVSRPTEDEAQAWARELRAWTEGNPLFIEELVRHLGERGLFNRALPPRIGDWVLPDDLNDLIARRVTRLSDQTGRALAVAAVTGPFFDIDVVEAAAGLSEEELLSALEEAEAAGVIVENPDAGGTYRFSHALVRDALYQRVSAARRARLHRRVGEALEARHEYDLDPYVAELARHFSLASPPDRRAIEYASRAGARAMAQLAFHEAAELYLGALEGRARLRHPVEGDEGEELLLQVQAVLALARSGDTDRAQEHLELFGLDTRDLLGVAPGTAEDVAALRARLTKDRAFAAEGAERHTLAQEAARLYEQIFDRLQRPYACINAATMWLVAGDDVHSSDLAATALKLAGETPPGAPLDAYWLAATEAEAALLLEDVGRCADALTRAVAQPAADLAARSVTRRQLELVCATKGIQPDVLNPLGIPREVRSVV